MPSRKAHTRMRSRLINARNSVQSREDVRVTPRNAPKCKHSSGGANLPLLPSPQVPNSHGTTNRTIAIALRPRTGLACPATTSQAGVAKTWYPSVDLLAPRQATTEC